jgi:hypothetical protein
MLLKPESEIAFTGGAWFSSSFIYKVDHSQDFDSVNGASSRFYERWDSSQNVFSTKHGFEIKYMLDSGVVKNKMLIRTGDNTSPLYFSVNSDVGNQLTEFWVESGDVIRGFGALNSTSSSFQFTCFDEMLYRSDGNDYESSIEFDVASNSMKYVVGGNFPTAINSGSTEGITIRRESFGGLVSMYWRSHVQGTQTIGYVSRDGYTGTWTVHHPTSNANIISWVIVGTAAEEAAANPPPDDPPENDPPPTPVFVPRSARRGNLNFW